MRISLFSIAIASLLTSMPAHQANALENSAVIQTEKLEMTGKRLPANENARATVQFTENETLIITDTITFTGTRRENQP